MTGSTVAGLLLTGGQSTRMGRDKATLRINGMALAQRLAGLLSEVASPVIEVGPQRTSLRVVLERERGGGPLVALCAGIELLTRLRGQGAVIVMACDLPNINRPVVELLARWPGKGTVLPVIEGREQPLCARWSRADLDMARERMAKGGRALRGLPGVAECVRLTEVQWGPLVGAETFADCDSPSDLRRLNLRSDLDERRRCQVS